MPSAWSIFPLYAAKPRAIIIPAMPSSLTVRKNELSFADGARRNAAVEDYPCVRGGTKRAVETKSKARVVKPRDKKIQCWYEGFTRLNSSTLRSCFFNKS
jgi:hypothetical protein